jgi:DNA polymerase-3 subunit alpha
MKPSEFVHLRCHSTYSLLEALPSPAEIVGRAKELKQTAVGIADKCHVYGLLEFYQCARGQGVKPILGCEVRIAPRSRLEKAAAGEDPSTPLTLLAETTEGYKNLLLLATKSALESDGDRPRIDADLLREHGRGLIALSGSLESEIAQAALREDGEGIKHATEKLWGSVGEGNVYFELMDLPALPGQKEANQQLITYGKKLGVPLVVTCPAHYCARDDAEAHDVLLCIRNNVRLEDRNRPSLLAHDLSMRPFEELEQAFSHVGEALENTQRIADRCSVDIPLGCINIPRFPVPKGQTEATLLRLLCEEGARARYKRVTKEVRERVEYELSVIEKMGFSGYFLIVADFVAEAKRRGITVGPGRGSAAGSIVSYCLGVTTLDPLAHGLLFERFLNPERISMPDIDLDFADNRRDEVLEYVAQKYGRDHAAQICTFGTLAARAAVKDVGRVFGMSFTEMNELAKLIPERPGTTLKQALEESSELKLAVSANEVHQRIIKTALKLEGKARHVSVHACGVIIAPEQTTAYTALQRAPKDEGTIITQYAAKSLEALGLLKMDFLGLKNLTVIQTTLEIIERLTGKKINMADIPLDDKKTYQLLSSGETTGVFQLESGGMRRYLKELQPSRFEDIVAIVALYRPGPMEWITRYIARKHRREEVEYLHKDLRGIFEETYGIGVYQEQILELARVFAGYSLGEADILRRAIGKKIAREMKAQKEKFVSGASRKGYRKDLADRIFDDVITPFAGYGFPKAHAASYARIAYETAYLKAHDPTAFMAALLSCDAQNTDRVAIEIEECRAMGIDVFPPDINESLAHFTALPQKKIRFGLTAVKGIGESSVRQMLEIRQHGGKFKDIDDFARRVPSRFLNKKTIEALAKAGALDAFGDRRIFIEHYDRIVDFSKAAGDAGAAQTDLFSVVGDPGGGARIVFPSVEPAMHQQKLQWEKETLGLYVTSHPLAGLQQYIGKKAHLVEQLGRKDVGRKVTIAGIEESFKKITTRKGESMAIVGLDDPTGRIEVTLFPRLYASVANSLGKSDAVIVVGGTLDMRNGQLQVRADVLKTVSLSRMIASAKADGVYDEEAAKRGLPVRRPMVVEREMSEVLDEEGNVVAGESAVFGEGVADEQGPLARFITTGMNIGEPLQCLRDVFTDIAPPSPVERAATVPARKSTPKVMQISIHTVPLPPEAPRSLLLSLKKLFERFPGRERIQLKIGDELVELPLTVTMSTILEKKIEDLLEKYNVMR